MYIDAIRGNDIYIIGDVDIVSTGKGLRKTIGDSSDKYELFVDATNIEGIYRYGAKQLSEDRIWGHGPGYVWSSRASVMNKEFDICLMEANYKQEGVCCYTTCAIDLVRFEQMLRDFGYEVDFTVKPDDNGEISYKIKKMEENNNAQ